MFGWLTDDASTIAPDKSSIAIGNSIAPELIELPF